MDDFIGYCVSSCQEIPLTHSVQPPRQTFVLDEKQLEIMTNLLKQMNRLETKDEIPEEKSEEE